MAFRAVILYLPVLWRGATALPAGPGSWPNGTVSPVSDVFTSAAYSLIDTYDANNWISKFDVEAVSILVAIVLLQLTRDRFPIPRVCYLSECIYIH